MEAEIKKILICSIDDCDNKVRANGLCAKHNHNRDRSGDVAGIYKIILKDKIYIGMSMLGVKCRVLTERSRLITNNPNSVNSELLKYFNRLCDAEPQLLRKQIVDKYFSYVIIDSSPRWLKVDRNLNTVEFKDKKEQKDLTFRANISTNPEMQGRKKMMVKMWLSKESSCIKHYKNLDKQDGTNKCLNIRN